MASASDSLMNSRILVIDDDPEVCGTMKSLISRMMLACDTAGTLREGLAALNEGRYDLVFLDVRLPDGNGLDHLQEIRSMPGEPEVVILTGQGDPDGAELAIQGGVWDYLVKPSPIKQTMLSIQRALKYRQEKRGSSPVVALDLENMVGRSQAMKPVFDFIAQAARSHAGALITGETGTGKELAARTVHENSARRGGKFVVLDCASLTETLVESTLFGHRKGAFTGANEDRTGLVKLADGGTLFLDEVGEMPMSLQKSFLRVLQEKRFRPVGETREVESDFRIVAATNRNLEAMVARGEFREDLLFRLKTISIELPPLRHRTEDLRPLAMHHVGRLCEQYRVPQKGFGSDFFEVLASYDWPGNVRELFNMLERAFVASGEERTLYAMHLPQEIRIAVTKASIGRSGGAEQAAAQQQTPPPAQQAPPATAQQGAPAAPQQDAPAAEAAPAAVPQAPPPAVPTPDSGNPLDALFAERTPSLKEFKTEMERRYLEYLLAMHGSNTKAILADSGLSRSHFYALLKKNGITPGND